MKKFFLVILLTLFFSSYSFGAASIESSVSKKSNSMVTYAFIITGGSDGAVITSSTGNPITLDPMVVMNVDFIPDIGDTQPSDEYNVYLVDAAGKDKIMNVGVDAPQARTDKDNTRTPVTTDGGLIYLKGTYYITATDMGADNKTVMIITGRKTTE
ncbi:MAG: hypothetical protein M0P71_15155 [Melioribacteraceae bacterium]|jgi:hypothetical protein|nr:hypothetical protein [Melioribacteraceae bacterium]